MAERKGVFNMNFSAHCLHCGETVLAALLRGSTRNLIKGGRVEVGHPTNDPLVGDHTWVLGVEAKATLRRTLFPWISVPWKKYGTLADMAGRRVC
jgi:hypothetical protein